MADLMIEEDESVKPVFDAIESAKAKHPEHADEVEAFLWLALDKADDDETYGDDDDPEPPAHLEVVRRALEEWEQRRVGEGGCASG